MTLLETLEIYRSVLVQRGRKQANQYLQDRNFDDNIIYEIENCFDDRGNALRGGWFLQDYKFQATLHKQTV